MSNDWWAKKLQQPGPRTSVPPSAPPQPVPYQYQQGQNVPVQYDPQNDMPVTRAQSAKQSEMCPGCNSGNYMAPQGTSLKRCYDCGYPLVQSGTGVGSTGTESGPVQAAKQPAKGSGFNPNIIVERLG